MPTRIKSRRTFLTQCGGLLLAGAVPRLHAAPPFAGDPFSLGVASGYPLPQGVALWTRLAPEPRAPGGGMPPIIVPVTWEVAADERFARVVASGTAYATPDWGHSVHVEVDTLLPARTYWYRFHAGSTTSPVGRTRTAPAPNAEVALLRFAVASCQHYEHGYFSAYRHMLDDDLDFIVHVGDYLYETSWGANLVRRHEAGEPFTLEDYRARFAHYRGDPDLQRAHAAYPWYLMWDDHEFENDYANDRSENADHPRWFRARRAAAYQAYYEHMPLRRSMLPFGPDMRLHARATFGQLAEMNLLDTRQYRTPQPCPTPGRGGARVIENCAQRLDPTATLLGTRQEHWLAAGLATSKARWNLLAQTTLMAQSDGKAGAGEMFFSDGWDGYPAARQRLLDQLIATRAANPVVFGGDVHSFWVADLKQDFTAQNAPTVASEFVTTSITSYPPPEDRIQTALAEGPHIHLATGQHRGYCRVEVTPQRLCTDLRVLDQPQQLDAKCSTLSTWIVEAGRPGPVPA